VCVDLRSSLPLESRSAFQKRGCKAGLGLLPTVKTATLRRNDSGSKALLPRIESFPAAGRYEERERGWVRDGGSQQL